MLGGKKINCGSRKKDKCKSAKKTCVWSPKNKKCSKRKAASANPFSKRCPPGSRKARSGGPCVKTAGSSKKGKKVDCRKKENKQKDDCLKKEANKARKAKEETKAEKPKAEKPKPNAKTSPKAEKAKPKPESKPKAKAEKPKKETNTKAKPKKATKQNNNQLDKEVDFLLSLILPYDRFNNNINEPEAEIYLHKEGKAVPEDILKPADVCGKYKAYKKRSPQGWDRVFGLELEPGKVHQFKSYNIYEHEPTTVDDSYKLENISPEQLEKHLCGSLIKMYKPSDLNPDHDNFIFTNNKYEVYFTGINHASNREDVVLILTKNNVLHEMIIPENGYIKDTDFGDVRDNEWMFMKHLRSNSYSDMIESKIDTGSSGNDGAQLQKSLVAYRPVDESGSVVIVHDGKRGELEIPEDEKLVEVNYDSNNNLFVRTDKNTYTAE